MNIEQKCKELRGQIHYHDRKYYINNDPEITDYEYDLLINELKQLENEHPHIITPDSPTQRIGAKPINAFNTVEHKLPMLSIENTYSPKELKEFDRKIRRMLDNFDQKIEYVVELKIDGVAISLWYENETFIRGATRGDGYKGDDVTANLKTLKDLPLRIGECESARIGSRLLITPNQSKVNIPPFLEIRGEVYLPNKDFQTINKMREDSNEPLFANPRNAAAGSLKLLDPGTAAKRRLHLFAYDIGYAEGTSFSTHMETLEYIKKLGLPVNPNHKLCNSIDEVIETCNKWESEREGIKYQVDGMVVKVNMLKLRDELGATSKAPRWMIAYKFHPEQSVTEVVSISIQVGKSGILTPVANLKPVHLAGTTVSRATLHNFEEVQRKDIRIGDYVTVQKAGDIIPQVVGVVKERRKGDEKPIEIPSECPVCNEKVERLENEVYIRCNNPFCSAQAKRRIAFFAGRDAMDIEGMGPAIVSQLVDKKLLNDFGDIYYLKSEDLITLEKMAEKSSQNLLNSIEKSKEQDLNHLICGLGIYQVGVHSAETLANRFGSLERLAEATNDELESIHEIGPIMAKSIADFFENKNIKIIIKKLKDANVNTKCRANTNSVGISKFTDKSFVITGTLERYSRNEAENIIKKSGGKVSSSLSKKTDFLIVGDSPGSKLQKAEKSGVKIINEKDFESMMQESGF